MKRIKPWLAVLTIISVAGACEFLASTEKEAPTVEKPDAKNGVLKVENNNGTYSEISYRDDKKEGPAILYFENGEIYKKSHYQNNELHGVSETYDRKGRLQRRVEYQKGRKHGKLQTFYNSGKVKLEIEYHQDKPKPGIFRRAIDGKEIPPPRIEQKQYNRYEGNPYRFRVAFTLSEPLREVQFIALPPGEEWLDLPPINKVSLPKYSLNVEKGTAKENPTGYIDHFVKPGMFVNNEFMLYAHFELKDGTTACVSKPVSYTFQN